MIATFPHTDAEDRRRLAASFLASLLIHLLLLILAVVLLSLAPSLLDRKPQQSSEETIQMTFAAPPRFVDSTQSTPADEPPENAAFESDQDTAGASAQPAKGNAPLPTTDGKERNALTLRDQDFTVGPNKAASAEPSTPANIAQTSSEPATQAREAQPQAESEPPAKTAAKPLPKPAEADLVLLEPQQPKTAPRPERERRPEAVVRKALPAVQPRPASPPGYQPQTQTTRLTGSFTNQGKPSFAARATPLGRYQKIMSDAVGSRWYYYVREMLGLITTGTVQVRFVVRQDGSIEAVQVRNNTSNESLASCSVRSVLEAEIPPIPPDIARSLNRNRLEVDYTFTVY